MCLGDVRRGRLFNAGGKPGRFGCSAAFGVAMGALLAGCAGNELALQPQSVDVQTAAGKAGTPSGSRPGLTTTPSTVLSPPAVGVTEARPAPSGVSVQPPAFKADQIVAIVGLKGSTVVLYHSDSGNAGEKFGRQTLSFPLPARTGASPSARLAVDTEYGQRWIDPNDVVLGPLATATVAKRAQ